MKDVPHKMKTAQHIQFSLFETSQNLIEAHIHDIEDGIGERRMNVNVEKIYCIISHVLREIYQPLSWNELGRVVFHWLKPVKSLLQLTLMM